MVTQEEIERLINSNLTQLLLVAEAALTASQFQAFRKFTLNEFGKNGLGKELVRLYNEKQHKER